MQDSRINKYKVSYLVCLPETFVVGVNGKINFYLSAIDKYIKDENDNSWC